MLYINLQFNVAIFVPFSEGQLLQPAHRIGLRNHQVHGPQIDPQSFLSGKISSQGLVEISLLLASLSNYSFNFDICITSELCL